MFNNPTYNDLVPPHLSPQRRAALWAYRSTYIFHLITAHQSNNKTFISSNQNSSVSLMFLVFYPKMFLYVYQYYSHTPHGAPVYGFKQTHLSLHHYSAVFLNYSVHTIKMCVPVYGFKQTTFIVTPLFRHFIYHSEAPSAP